MNPATTYLVRPGRVGALCELVRDWRAVVLDTETRGKRPYLDAFLGVSVGSLDDDACYYLPHGHTDGDNIDREEFMQLLAALQGKPLIGHNIKFEMHVLSRFWGKTWWWGKVFDTIVEARLDATEEHPKLDLESLATRLLNYTYLSSAAGQQEFFGDDKFTVHEIGLKCNEDVHCTRGLYKHYKGKLPPELVALFVQEMNLTPGLWEMEAHGINFDPQRTREMADKLLGLFEGLQLSIRQTLDDFDFNLRSPDDVSRALRRRGHKERRSAVTAAMQARFIKAVARVRARRDSGKELLKSASDLDQKVYQMMERGVDDETITKAITVGNPIWNRERLGLAAAGRLNDSNGATPDPLPKMIAQARALTHNHDTLLEELQFYINAGVNTVHGSYKNWGTVTGRLSSSGPNLQNFPKGWLHLDAQTEDFREVLKWKEDERDENNINLRALFTPPPGYVFVRADYRQLEMFIAGYYLKDPNFMALLATDDFHTATAEWVWGSARYRDRAKWFNFGLLYGLGILGLSERLNCTKAEAEDYQRDYFRKIPTYPIEMARLRAGLRRDGYVKNRYGRRYYLPVEWAYIAFNYRVQGSAGDFVKFREPLLREPARERGIRIVMNTHDEYVFAVPEQRLDTVFDLVSILEDAQDTFGMTLPVSLKVGRHNLGELEELSGSKEKAIARPG